MPNHHEVAHAWAHQTGKPFLKDAASFLALITFTLAACDILTLATGANPFIGG